MPLTEHRHNQDITGLKFGIETPARKLGRPPVQHIHRLTSGMMRPRKAGDWISGEKVRLAQDCHGVMLQKETRHRLSAASDGALNSHIMRL